MAKTGVPIMTNGFKAIAFAAAMAGAVLVKMAQADEVLAPDPGIEATIQSQIDAFLADDFVTAFEFASPGIQGMFGNAERFGAMVRNGYPMVWRPEAVEFGDLRAVAGGLYQRVLVTDAMGVEHMLEYRMSKLEGGWRISGVQIIAAPEVSA
jgi:hypothetical protein